MFLHLICLKEIWPENLWFFLAYYISFNTIFSSLSSKFMQDFIFSISRFENFQIFKSEIHAPSYSLRSHLLFK